MAAFTSSDYRLACVVITKLIKEVLQATEHTQREVEGDIFHVLRIELQSYHNYSCYTLLTTRRKPAKGLELLQPWQVCASPLSDKRTVVAASETKPRSTTGWFRSRDDDACQRTQ